MGKLKDRLTNDWNTMWQKDNLGGTITGLAGGVVSAVGAGITNAQIQDTSDDESFIENVGNQQFNSSSTDNLMASFDTVNGMARTNYTRDDLKALSTGQHLANLGLSTLGGFAQGASSGNLWLGLGKAILDGVGSGIGWATEGPRLQKKATELNRLAEDANKQYLNNFANAASNTQNKMFNNSLLNIAAYGGPLFNHGGDWSNGLTFINEGGTHEQNPLGGVPVGVDQEGTPNLVEEGEIIWNDYVFSNRLKPTKKQLETVGFNPKYEGMTFAEVVEKVQQESAENPLDKISTDTLNENLMYLMTMQEEIRMKKEAKKNKFDLGGPTDSTAVAIGNLANQIAEEQYYKYLGYPNAEVGKRIQKEQKYTKAINSLFERFPIENTLESILSKFSKKEKTTGRNKKESNKFPDGGGLYDGVFTVYGNNGKPIYLPTAESLIKKYNLDEDIPIEDIQTQDVLIEDNSIDIPEFDWSVLDNTTTNKSKLPWWQSAMRYASPALHGILLANNLQKPDYSDERDLMRKASSMTRGSHTPLGTTLDLDLMDRNVYTNPILANAAANRRALQQGPTDPRAALLANNYITNNALGMADIQGTQANNEIKSKIAQFELTKGQANAELALRDLAMDQQADQVGLNVMANAIQSMSAKNAMRNQAISAEASGLADDFTMMARERDDRALMEKLIGSGALQWTKAKNGGMLTRNRRRK